MRLPIALRLPFTRRLRLVGLLLLLGLALGLAFWDRPGLGEDAAPWTALDAAQMTSRLTAGPVRYEDGAEQLFYPDGRTLYRVSGGAESWGKWWVAAGRYCSSWPPSESIACFDLEVSGDALRFVSDRGQITAGRFGAPD